MFITFPIILIIFFAALVKAISIAMEDVPKAHYHKEILESRNPYNIAK